MYVLVLTYFCTAASGDLCSEYIFDNLSREQCLEALEMPQNIAAATQDQGRLTCAPHGDLL